MTDDDELMRRWLEPVELLRVVQRDVSISGIESAAEVIMREPSLLIPVPFAENPPLDIPTYEVRLARWRDGEGPRLTGMEHFVEVLTSLQVVATAVFVSGVSTTYGFIMDDALTRVLAAVAIDPPA